MNLITKVIEVDGELAIEIPQEMIDSIGWKVGNEVVWTELPGGVWTIEQVLDITSSNPVQYDIFNGEDDE